MTNEYYNRQGDNAQADNAIANKGPVKQKRNTQKVKKTALAAQKNQSKEAKKKEEKPFKQKSRWGKNKFPEKPGTGKKGPAKIRLGRPFRKTVKKQG